MSASPRDSRDPLLFLLWTAFCVIMVAVAVRDYARDGGHEWWKPLLWEGSSMLCATAIFWLQRRASPRYASLLGQPWAWFGVHLRWAVLAALLFIASIYAIRHAVYAALGLVYTHEPWLQVLAYEAAKFAIFACLWLGVIFSVDSHSHWQAQRERLLVLQQSLSQARLAQLSAQLRPHFLFNALNTISALMHVDVARADRLLATLGELLRESLQTAPAQLVPLRRELHLLALYAQVMAERFADRVSIEWHIDEAAQEAPVPALLLQPLLENAFKHGVETSSGPVRIRIHAELTGNELTLVVANTGELVGTPQDRIGLRNCRERLTELYQGRAELRLTSEAGEVRATVRLPFTRSTS